MYEFIPSEYYLNYCKGNGIEIAGIDLAAAIINEDLDPLDGEKPTLEERLAALKNIAAKTEDSELKALISEAEETSRTAVVLGVSDEEDLSSWERYFFYDYEMAYNYILTKVAEQGDLRSFDIERITVFTGDEEPKSVWNESAYFNSCGAILRINGDEVERGVKFIREQSEHTSNGEMRAALEKAMEELSKV